MRAGQKHQKGSGGEIAVKGGAFRQIAEIHLSVASGLRDRRACNERIPAIRFQDIQRPFAWLSICRRRWVPGNASTSPFGTFRLTPRTACLRLAPAPKLFTSLSTVSRSMPFSRNASPSRSWHSVLGRLIKEPEPKLVVISCEFIGRHLDASVQLPCGACQNVSSFA